MDSHARKKIRAARLAVTTATLLALAKGVIGLFSGSMAIITSAVDSLLDIMMSGVNYVAIRHAERPADECHPFGHGKYETLATIFQALVITSSGVWIIIESSARLRQGRELSALGSGIFILLAASFASWLLSQFLKRVAAETDSSALAADSLHFSMDIYTNLVLALGVAAVAFFDLYWVDPALSIVVALYIIWQALGLLRHGIGDVLDRELPTEMQEQIDELIRTSDVHALDYHNLRTRRAGSHKIMDFHLTLCKHLSVEEAHAISDSLEKRIEEDLRPADVTIHIEPCARADCPGYQRCDKRDRFEQEKSSSGSGQD
ncbi:MAG: cation transporter [Desulfuromonas sp.]|nr:MAG: cation transporter [Desulfuromonas sp.]